jgi:RimJ/RimL family protein N-acetyltransferase
MALVRDGRIAPSLSPLAAEALQAALDDTDGGVLIIESDGRRTGVVCWSTKNRRSRIAGLHTLAIHPDHHRRGFAVTALREVARLLFDEYGFHRLEAEIYGFNAPARQAFAAAGFTEEGTRRRAYDRHGAWQDGVHFGLLTDD